MIMPLPMTVIGQVRRDSKEVILSMRFALVYRACAKKAVKRFLQQIVGKLGVAGPAPQEYPQRTGGPFVDGLEGFLVHLKRVVRPAGYRLEPLKFGKGNVTHWVA